VSKRGLLQRQEIFAGHVAHCIIPVMSIPEFFVTDTELKRSTGERGTRKYIAYQGVVYDVTDCPKWRTDLHEQMHFPGQDLTSELPDAPHAEEVFSRPCVKVIGKLQSIPR
jgi:predicted heme/steroid binding protein